LTSRTRIIQETGENPDEIFAELEQEQKIINAKGLAVAPVTVQATKPGSIAPAPNEQQTQEDAKTKANGNGTFRLAAILAERGRS
jgi:capsid protein